MQHPLLDEAKAELDLLFSEISRLRQLSVDAAETGTPVQSNLTDELVGLYSMQSHAISRFEKLSTAFALAGLSQDPESAVGMLRSAMRDAWLSADMEPDLYPAACSFFTTVKRIEVDGRTSELEKQVRDAWSVIEGVWRSDGLDWSLIAA